MACTGPTFFTFYIKRVVEEKKKKVVGKKNFVMLHELNTIGGGG
jgi:hypothetical protein